MFLDRVKAILDELRLVPDNRDLQVLRQCRDDLRHAVLDVANDGHRV